MHLLKTHLDKIDWDDLTLNPSIFEVDTNQMKIELTKRAKNIYY